MTGRCGYPAGQEHPHVEQCHRAERERVLAQVEALVMEFSQMALCRHEWERIERLRALVASVREGAER